MGRMLNEFKYAHIFSGQQQSQIEGLLQDNTALQAQAGHRQHLFAQRAARLDVIEGHFAEEVSHLVLMQPERVSAFQSWKTRKSLRVFSCALDKMLNLEG